MGRNAGNSIYRVHRPTPFEPDPKEIPVSAAVRPAKRCSAALLHEMTHKAILHALLSALLRACVDMWSSLPREARRGHGCPSLNKTLKLHIYLLMSKWHIIIFFINTVFIYIKFYFIFIFIEIHIHFLPCSTISESC